MRFLIKLLLFISAYTPLFVILLIKNFDYSQIIFWVIITLLILADVVLLIIFKISKQWTNQEIKINDYTNRTSDALNYVIAYVIAFLAFNINLWQDIASLIILLIVTFVIYINSNLIFVNPLLNLLGYKFYEVTNDYGNKTIIITKKEVIKGKILKVKNFDKMIYLEQ